MAKILIADDEKDIRDLVDFTLKITGHEVIAVENGEKAVQVAAQIIPDLIMLDSRMPGMSGHQACQVLKADPLTARIPIAILSANSQEADIQAGIEAGANEYLVKPFSPMDLLRDVNGFLAKYQGSQQ